MEGRTTLSLLKYLEAKVRFVALSFKGIGVQIIQIATLARRVAACNLVTQRAGG